MPYRALTDVLLGSAPAAHPGELIPDTFVDTVGDTLPVDFERLVDLGAAEEVKAEVKPKPASHAKKD